MKTFILSALFLGLTLANSARAEIVLVPVDSEIITGPELSFEQRVDEKIDLILQKVHSGELRDALSLSRQLESQISFELRKTGGESNCELERRCERQSLR